jgi:hypothetical protein
VRLQGAYDRCPNDGNRQDGCKSGSLAIIIAGTVTSCCETPMADTENILVRSLSRDPEQALREMDRCVTIQRAVGWGSEAVPSHEFRADSIRGARVAPSPGKAV